MDALIGWRGAGDAASACETERRLAAFRAADAFATAAAKTARGLDPAAGGALAAEILSRVLQCGAALLRASEASRGSDGELDALVTAERGLVEARYALYLARRVGVLDLRRYRGLSAQHDAAAREIHVLRDRAVAARGPRAP
jgi:hypothetical protein